MNINSSFFYIKSTSIPSFLATTKKTHSVYRMCLLFFYIVLLLSEMIVEGIIMFNWFCISKTKTKLLFRVGNNICHMFINNNNSACI